ncbi:membrane biogenesis protein [Talaromyces pinophilus]|uniref:Protein YOP1 n=1 Tax=Talaromyces pinophilus TaxID=128442 RepID=A0A510NUV5_TALPI|nr:membrane biogenesis protein [Talaromyces pinophilus]
MASFQDRAQHQIAQLDKELSKYPLLNNLERQTSVPKVYAILGLYWVVYAFLTVIESAINASYWFPFYYIFKFALVLWMSLPQFSGAQVVFHSFIQPLFARFFSSGSTSSNLKAQAEAASKSQ